MAGNAKSSTSAKNPFDPSRPELRHITELLGHRPLSLADYHALGEQLRRLAEDPAVGSLGGWRQKVAQAVGVSVSTLNKALQFRQEYEAEDVPELEELAVGWARLTTALALKDRLGRHALLKRARREGWDDRDVQRAVQRLKGSRRGGGRPRKERQSHGLLADLAELTRLAELWAGFYEQVWAANQPAYAAEVRKLPGPGREGVRRHLAAAREKLAALRKGCGGALAGLKNLGVE